ncbi:NUDIX domain-containing protein [Patescibacteria group bacterium]|nr:NUDIX domain-containing protein [Patescibacteria group bacterium]MCL5091639.1 NUDIX domain-containing protein [Patescibacteria group bacterium]
MIKRFLEEIKPLRTRHYVDQSVYQRFVRRINQGNLTKTDNPRSHVCVFFLPVDASRRKIYLGHHIKANDWIPPGGHIDPGELPRLTVRRESREELRFDPDPLTIHLFDLSIKPIVPAKFGCARHFDIWYIVRQKTQRFAYLKREYYAGRWVNLAQANQLVRRNPDYLRIINKLPDLVFRQAV